MTCCTRRADVVIAFASLGPHPDYKFGTVKRIDPKTGEAKVLYKEANGHLLSAPGRLRWRQR
jgi:hypothetical protein